MAHAWMTEARRIQAAMDGGHLRGGAPRAVWLALGTVPRTVSVHSAAHSVAQRLISECRPCHLVWDPLTGEVVQLVSILRAACALGVPDHLKHAGHIQTGDVNTEGRVCVQIGVLTRTHSPFTDGPLNALGAIVSWLDSWGIPRRWPAGSPHDGQPDRDRALWARGGHFGASQVPGCENTGPGTIDIDRLTGPFPRRADSLGPMPILA